MQMSTQHKDRAQGSSSGAASKKTKKDTPTQHDQDNLDESLQETFPASDPIAPAQPADKKHR